ncbi:MAG: archease [Dehalococcoidia bacterium]
MRKAFETIDHTADVGIVAYGRDVAELFSNAGLALFSLITELESIEEKLHRTLEVSSEDPDSLLVNWLNELIYMFDAEHMLFNRFDIDSLSANLLCVTCYGEMFDPSKHTIKIGVKAATYHMLTVQKDTGGYKARVIFDI